MALIIPAKVRRMLTIGVGSIIILGGIFVIFSPEKSSLVEVDYLKPHEVIEHGARINATVESVQKNGTVTIELKIDSTEHQEFLDLNFEEVCLLEINNDAPFVANKVSVVSSDDYSKTLHIEFTGIREPITDMKLHVFGLLGTPLRWELEPPSEN